MNVHCRVNGQQSAWGKWPPTEKNYDDHGHVQTSLVLGLGARAPLLSRPDANALLGVSGRMECKNFTGSCDLGKLKVENRYLHKAAGVRRFGSFRNPQRRIVAPSRYHSNEPPQILVRMLHLVGAIAKPKKYYRLNNELKSPTASKVGWICTSHATILAREPF